MIFVIPLLLLAGALTALAPHRALIAVAPDTLCLDGTMGGGPRTRRIVLAVAFENVTAGDGLLALHTRPPRTFRARVTRASPDSLVIVARDSAAGERTVGLRRVAGASWTGYVASSRDTLPVALHETARTDTSGEWAAGAWMGVVGRSRIPVRLGVNLARAACGLLSATFDSPDQGQSALPATAVRVTADSVVLEAEYIALRIAIARGDGDTLAASFSQRGGVEQITLERLRAAGASRRPQEPVRPYPYAEREIAFERLEARLRFEGTLTIPSGPGPHPALLLLSGSGAQDRDETVAGHRPFLVLADYLTRQGFAVFRFDDRGTQRTPASALNTSLEDRVGDAAAAVRAVRRQPEIDTTRVGLLGHSEGGYVAQLLAVRDDDVRFAIMLAAPATRGRDLLLAQRAALNRGGGTAAAEVALDSLMLQRLFQVLDHRPPPADLERRLDEALQQWLPTLSAAQRRYVEGWLGARTAAQDSATLALWTSQWFQSFYHHDPSEALRHLRIPVLAIYGDRDLQVPAHLNVAAIERLGADAQDRFKVYTLPGLNHLLQPARTGLPSEYIDIAETIAPPVLEIVRDWLLGVARR